MTKGGIIRGGGGGGGGVGQEMRSAWPSWIFILDCVQVNTGQDKVDWKCMLGDSLQYLDTIQCEVCVK